MSALGDMVWVELHKALRSRVPLLTGVKALSMPAGIAFLIFLARNPEISRSLGLVSAKADLIAYSATDWPAYLRLAALIVAAGGFFLMVLVISWVFGREVLDGTVKDLLAVPVSRATILLAKFVVFCAWSMALGVMMLLLSLCTGAVIGLPGGTPPVILRGSGVFLLTVVLMIGVTVPFAFIASAGRGYLPAMGLAVLTLITANLAALAGWVGSFPWAIPGAFAQGEQSLPAASYVIVVLTALAGIIATYAWWMWADRNR